MSKTLIAAATALVGAATVAAATAWAATPAETVVARQNNFKQMARASKAIADEFRKPAADIAVIRGSAQTLAGFAPQIHRWFPRGTGPEAGAKTGALPVIWQRNAQFGNAANQLVNATRNFQRVAASGDVGQIRAAFPAVGAACKGCHETFKGDK